MGPVGMEPVTPASPGSCSNCGNPLEPSANYCHRCGKPVHPYPAPLVMMPYPPYAPPKDNTIRDLGMGVGTYASVGLLTLMMVNVIIAIWGVGEIYPHMDKHYWLYIITPYIVNFAELTDWTFLLYYVLLVAAIAASLIWMMVRSVRPLVPELKLEYPTGGHSPLYLISTMLMAVLAFNVVYYMVVEAAGIVTNTPSFDTRALWQTLYSFAAASVWEEVVSRILLIGVPLLLIDTVRRRRGPQGPERKVSNYILGGGFDIGRTEAVLMVFSSIMFGLAHIWSWDFYKFFPAAMAGLAFAYLFLKLGVYASILMHFGIDFMSVPLDVFPDDVSVTMVLGLAILIWMAIGMLYLVLYTSKGLGWLVGKRLWPDVPMAPKRPTPVQYQWSLVPPAGTYGYYPPPQASPSPVPLDNSAFGYVCKVCGNREAAYVDGHLTCLRCGNKD